MILSTLAESGRVEHLHPAFKLVLDYVKSHDLTKVPAERIALDGDRVFINVDAQRRSRHLRCIAATSTCISRSAVANGWGGVRLRLWQQKVVANPLMWHAILPFTTCRLPLTLMWCRGSSTSCIPKMPMPLLLAAVHCANLWQR